MKQFKDTSQNKELSKQKRKKNKNKKSVKEKDKTESISIINNSSNDSEENDNIDPQKILQKKFGNKTPIKNTSHEDKKDPKQHTKQSKIQRVWGISEKIN
jgi:hypothetical protein